MNKDILMPEKILSPFHGNLPIEMIHHEASRLSLPLYFETQESQTSSPPSTPMHYHDKAFSDPGTGDDAPYRKHELYRSNSTFPTSPSATTSSSTCSTTHFSPWQLILLTSCLAGAQFVWTIEMGYGTPLLTSLGMSKPVLTLAWLAGPLSGLIMQPLVGAWSDRCRSRLGKRRPFIILGVIGVVTSLLLMAYARPMMTLVGLDQMPPGPNNSDDDDDGKPHPVLHASVWTMLLVVFAFYVLDFAINAVQASCRSLIVDVLSTQQQSTGTSYASAMVGIGNVSGYFVGSLNLVALFPWMGNQQIEILALVACFVMLLTMCMTVLGTREQSTAGVRDYRHPSDTSYQDEGASFWASIVQAVRHLVSVTMELPRQVRLVLQIQFFAWIGWFPFNFFSTEYVKEIVSQREHMGDLNAGVRLGSMALLLFSIVSIVGAIILPALRRYCGIPLSHFWVASNFMFAILMFSTVLVHDHVGATIIIALVGVCWAVAMWVPLSLLGEFISSQRRRHRENTFGSSDEYVGIVCEEDHPDRQPYDAGVILGIHNAFVVLPQLLASLMSSIVFVLAGEGPTSIEWVWQMGGLAALIASGLARKIHG